MKMLTIQVVVPDDSILGKLQNNGQAQDWFLENLFREMPFRTLTVKTESVFLV